jgi:AmiR/NasT family two-component response regulator
MTEPEAFRWIQKTSMDRRISMREVAQAVLDQAKAASRDDAAGQAADPSAG